MKADHICIQVGLDSYLLGPSAKGYIFSHPDPDRVEVAYPHVLTAMLALWELAFSYGLVELFKDGTMNLHQSGSYPFFRL